MQSRGDSKGFAVAKVGKSFGIHGELTISLYDTFPADFTIEEPLFVYIDNLAVPLFFDHFERRGKSGGVVIFADFDNTLRASELIGKQLFMGLEAELLGLEPEEDVEEEFDEDDELYLEDFVGFEASFEGLEQRGEIVDFEEDDWNPLFIIDIEGREVMIPAADDFIVEYSPTARTVHFDLPEGLLDLNN